MIGLLVATIDCLGGYEKVQAQYDRITGHELFQRFGLSSRPVEDFIKPTLLVVLFKPAEELSALVMMELLHYFALAHTDSFDVRWIRNGTVSDSLIVPGATKLQQDYNLQVLDGCRVGKITLTGSICGKSRTVDTIEYHQRDGTKEGVVLALTCSGVQAVVGASPDLAPLTWRLRLGADVISVRLRLDKADGGHPTPANVLPRFKGLGVLGDFFRVGSVLKGQSGRTPWRRDIIIGITCELFFRSFRALV